MPRSTSSSRSCRRSTVCRCRSPCRHCRIDFIERIQTMMFRSKSFLVTLAALAVAFAGRAHAGDHPVSQVNKTFSMPVVKAKVGDTVTFKNDDTFAHNVFSLSDVQNFDLGSYKKGETRQLKLTNPGTIEVECAIHPEMKMKIEVSK